jgi:predicted flap endonuclease-1-like 5' DNA nuclease
MRSDIATSHLVLKAERERLDGLLARAVENAGVATIFSALQRARDQLSGAIEALEQAGAHLDAETVPAPALADRIVLIEPGETFRTKIKLKATERRSASPSAGAEPAATVAPTDDLTVIRGIDRRLAQALGDHGVVSFAQIAAWEKDDVGRFSAALGLGRQISQQNWIEQAALLRARQVSPKIEARPPAAVTAAEAEAPPGAEQPAPLPLPVRHDRLTLIKGVGSSMVGPLAGGGVTQFADISTWQPSDVAFWQAKLGTAARISKDGWIEQAALLASGRSTAYAGHVNAGFPASIVAKPASETLPHPVFSDWSALAIVVEPVNVEHAKVTFEPASPPPEPVSVTPIELPPAVEILDNNVGITPLSTMDRVSALEQELVSLVANDTTMPAADQNLQPEADAYPSFYGEADVVIVRNKGEPSVTERDPPDREATLLTRRTKRALPIEDIEPETYDAYKNRVEEASVEIIGSRRAAVVKIPESEGPAWQRYGTESVTRPISRLIRGLIRRD